MSLKRKFTYKKSDNVNGMATVSKINFMRNFNVYFVIFIYMLFFTLKKGYVQSPRKYRIKQNGIKINANTEDKSKTVFSFKLAVCSQAFFQSFLFISTVINNTQAFTVILNRDISLKLSIIKIRNFYCSFYYKKTKFKNVN